jgi:hypothetical protein
MDSRFYSRMNCSEDNYNRGHFFSYGQYLEYFASIDFLMSSIFFPSLYILYTSSVISMVKAHDSKVLRKSIDDRRTDQPTATCDNDDLMLIHR